jgi:predicted phage gp36 major capsid-like protein
MTDERLVSWRDYVDSRFSASDRAVEVALDELRRRLEEMNRFREENRTQAASMVGRDLFDSQLDRIEGLVATEREARRAAEGSLATWRFIAGFLGLSGIVGLLLGAIAVVRP